MYTHLVRPVRMKSKRCEEQVVNCVSILPHFFSGIKKLESFGRRLLTVSRAHMRETLLKIDHEFAFPERYIFPLHKFRLHYDIVKLRLLARETFLIRVLTTVGEVVQFCPRLMNCGIKLFEALKTILSSDIIDEKCQPG